ncbi:MAG: hypothetical protein HY735_12110 [Verrucomicrobia bacterium]|nr:hypothetical protein [Verrucomicrobiota bacterium]
MAKTIPLKTQGQIRAMFVEASNTGFQPYHWVPPDWATVLNNKFKLEDNAADAEGFNKTFFNIADPNEFVSSQREKEMETELTADPETPPGKNRKEWKWPHPASDFNHVDPIKSTPDKKTRFSDKELQRIKEKLDLAGEAKLSKYAEELTRLVGPSSQGMKRLGVVFEWIVLKATMLLSEINSQLDSENKTGYEAVQENYIKFLQDLDDHEPQTKQCVLNPSLKRKDDESEAQALGRKSGYGRAIKWAYVAPVIVGGRIKAARIIAHWNPHSSSLGVPVVH